MKKSNIVGLFLIFNLNAVSQVKFPTIKISPTALLHAFPTLELSSEQSLTKRSSIELTGGSVLNINSINRSDYTNKSGYNLELEYRRSIWYFGMYYAFGADIGRVKYDYAYTVSNQEFYPDSINILDLGLGEHPIKHDRSFIGGYHKVGWKKIIKQKFTIEVYHMFLFYNERINRPLPNGLFVHRLDRCDVVFPGFGLCNFHDSSPTKSRNDFRVRFGVKLGYAF